MRLLFACLWAALFVGAAPGTARAEWWEARTDHFIVYSESSARDARQFAAKLERFDQALRSLQGLGPDEKLSDSRRLTVFRFGDIGDISVFAGSSSSGIAGFYIPRASGPVAFVPVKEQIGKKSVLDAQTVLFHEYAHHFMYRYFSAAYPSWYVEGFAEINSTIDFRDDGSFLIGSPPQSRGEALAGGLHYSIKQMLLSKSKPRMEDFFGRYTYGWLLTHYLTFEPSRKGQLQKFLKLINDGTDSAEAAQLAFGDVNQLESDVLRYKGRNRYPGAEVQPGKSSAPTVAMRRLSPDEEAIMRVRTRSTRGVTLKQARDVAGDARAIAAKYPASLPVLLALTEAEFDARNFDEAERAANAALAIDSNAVEAMLFKGRVELERAKSDASRYASARTLFARANRADPGHPSPLQYYYLSYTKAGIAPPENAVAGLERAFVMAPYDDDLRMVLVRQLLSEGEGGLARQFIVPLASAPHESKSAAALNEVLGLIDSGNVGEALSKLNARMAEEERKREKGVVAL